MEVEQIFLKRKSKKSLNLIPDFLIFSFWKAKYFFSLISQHEIGTNKHLLDEWSGCLPWREKTIKQKWQFELSEKKKKLFLHSPI